MGRPRRSPQLHDGGTYRWGDMAVFYRTNAQSRVLEEHARCARGIPYKVIGGTRFYDRREVKDALAYLQGGREPGRRGVGQAGAQRAQAGRRRQHRRPARRVRRRRTACTFIEALRRADDAGVTGTGGRRASRAS